MFDSISRQLRGLYLANETMRPQHDDDTFEQTEHLIINLSNDWDTASPEQKIQLLRESGHEFDSTDEIYYRSQL